jgi:hypothetical protein
MSNPSIHIFAAPADPVATPTLRSASLSGFTPDGGNDKDNDTQLKITLPVDFGGGFTQTVASTDFQAYGRFADGQPWGPLDIPVKGAFAMDNVPRMSGLLEFQPRGDDSWVFNYSLNLTFTDGTVISKNGNNSLSDSKRSCPI